MNDDLHNIDDLFKKALEEHTDLPSPTVWENIDNNLDKKKVVSISEKYNKLKWAAAILLLFSVGMAMYTLHIRMKNKELVKQNDSEKILKTPKRETNNNLKDSAGFTENNNAGTKKPNINTEQERRIINDDTSKIRDNEITPAEDNNTTDNIQQTKKQVINDAQIKSPGKGKTEELINQQNQKQSLQKNKSLIKTKKQYALNTPDNTDNNGKKDLINSVINNNDKETSLNNEEQRKLYDNIASLKEKYPASIPPVNELKDMFQLLFIKPFSQITNAIANNSVPLKEQQARPLKQRNIKNAKSSLLSATVFFSPDIVSTNIKNDHPHFREDDRLEIEKNEKISSSSTIGLLVDFNMGKNWKIGSGLTFSTRITDIQPKTIYARPDNNGNINYRFNCSAGYSFVTLRAPIQPVSGDSIRALMSKNTLQYIGVPLTVKHTFTKGRFGLTPGVGISANFLSKGKIQTDIATSTGNESATSNNIQGLKTTYFNGLASIGAEYNLNKNMTITFIPTARFALSSITKNAPVKTNLNSIGLAGGIIIKF